MGAGARHAQREAALVPGSLPASPSGIALAIAPVGAVDPALLAWLEAELPVALPGLRCATVRPLAPRPEPAGPGRRYPADALLDSLVGWHDAQAATARCDWLLGVTELDLCTARQDRVYGEATVGGCCALISLAALRPAEPAVSGERLALLRTRILKESLHELGHVAGLRHCRRRCVMRPAPDLRAVDARLASFCPECERALDARLNDRA